MARHFAANMLTLLIVGALLLAGILGWARSQFNGAGPLTEPIFFEVPRGATLAQVSDDLAESGAIANATLFRLGADYAGQEGALKFGSYELPAGASMAEILDILTEGGRGGYRYVVEYVIGVAGAETRLIERLPGTGEATLVARFASGDPVPASYAALVEDGAPMVRRLTLVPGSTVRMAVEALRAAPFLSGEIAEMPAEGMLAPDTYEVENGESRARLLAVMQARQQAILADAWGLRAAGLPLATPQEALTLASIIEKETAVASERPLVASVFVNRLNAGMRLQTDPTVIYGVTDGLGFMERGITRSDLRQVTAYNTYVIDGLPPSPIANPSRAAIEAALAPATSDYFYFVADGTGGHAFATTLAEHNRNVQRWREIEGARQQAE
ncbi:MAG: endolytic transglycosylase MltG [Rhodobacteraceae bacterium]|jgi:UPF0755 protein|nr:endolytic transglycosylase MltG [Paracoccaceae bacterium]